MAWLLLLGLLGLGPFSWSGLEVRIRITGVAELGLEG